MAAKLASLPRKHDNDNPLWLGPCADGWNGGVTQTMIGRFLSCRERFRLKYVCGLEPSDRWSHRLGYGNMWHAAEQAHATGTEDWGVALGAHTEAQLAKYPLQREEIYKWYEVCCVQFPEYVKYWGTHPDVRNRTPLMQEEVFDVPYLLPSGRTVRLRGRWDSVDLITDEITGPRGGIYLQENKTKSDIDRERVERQLSFDLQTMLYLIAMSEWQDLDDYGIPIRFAEAVEKPILGVRYNVVRRPLSGGKGNISPHKAKATKTKFTPAESAEDFYKRLRNDYIAKEPDYWFFRIRAEISAKDVEVFRETCLDPVLEQMCQWYDQITGNPCHWKCSPWMNYRMPFGVYNPLDEGGATEYDAYMATGSEAGLRRVTELFSELK